MNQAVDVVVTQQAIAVRSSDLLETLKDLPRQADKRGVWTTRLRGQTHR